MDERQDLNPFLAVKRAVLNHDIVCLLGQIEIADHRGMFAITTPERIIICSMLQL